MPGIGLLSEINKPQAIVSKELVFCNIYKPLNTVENL